MVHSLRGYAIFFLSHLIDEKICGKESPVHEYSSLHQFLYWAEVSALIPYLISSY